MTTKNPITRSIPSYIVPTEPIDLNGLVLSQGGPVQVSDDWQRLHYSASLKVYEEDLTGRTDKWVAFHSLLAHSRLPLYAFYSYGHAPSDFQVSEIYKKKNPKAEARTIPFHPNNCLPAVYFNSVYSSLPNISYQNLYKYYNDASESYKIAVQNFFLAQDIGFHSRLRGTEKSFWTVVMLIASLEAMLPVRKGDTAKYIDKDWNELLFDRIEDSKIKKQYRAILDTARWKIRNDTVHNGLAPPQQIPHASLPNGITLYTTETIIKSYLNDKNSLEGFVDQLVDLCRYVLLNKIVKRNVFPKLQSAEIHSITFKSITSSNTTLSLDVGTDRYER